MRFTKMHGLGNDYVYINCFEEAVVDAPSLARAISDRHFGVGADGLILICPSTCAQIRMEMYNADGSRGQMCGNGIRCVAKYAIENGLASGPDVLIETDAGGKLAQCQVDDGLVSAVRVNMGEPNFQTKSLPSSLCVDEIIDRKLSFCQSQWRVTALSIGNPHAVIFVDSLEEVDLQRDGPLVENAGIFPERINVHFAQVLDRSHILVKTWERGSGATLACGTGACATLVAGVTTERCERTADVQLPGGTLRIDWLKDGPVYMTGPASYVFSGDWPV